MYFFSSWGLIFLAGFIDVIAILVIKSRLNQLGPISYENITVIFNYCIDVIKTPQTFISVLFLFISPLIYGFALSRVNLSTAYPVLVGFSTLCLIFFSNVYLKETITLNVIIGSIFILIGITIIYFK